MFTWQKFDQLNQNLNEIYLFVTWMHSFPLIFLWFIYQNEIIHADTKYCTIQIWAVVLLLSESHAIINNLDVILHGFMLQIIYTTVFRVKQLNNRTWTLHVRLFNRLTQKTVVQILLTLIDWCLTPTLAIFQCYITYIYLYNLIKKL